MRDWTIEMVLGLLTIGALLAIAHCAAPQYDIKSRCVQWRKAVACASYNRSTGRLTVQVLDDGE